MILTLHLEVGNPRNILKLTTVTETIIIVIIIIIMKTITIIKVLPMINLIAQRHRQAQKKLFSY